MDENKEIELMKFLLSETRKDESGNEVRTLNIEANMEELKNIVRKAGGFKSFSKQLSKVIENKILSE